MTTARRSDDFLWLTEELALVQTKKYFVVDISTGKSPALFGNRPELLPREYAQFIERFGSAMLYRQHIGYGLGVMAPPLEVASKRGGEPLLYFGHFLDRPAYFKVEHLQQHTKCPVFEGQSGRLVLAADGFAAWLQRRAAMLRSRIEKKRWEEIVAGPPAFSPVEQQIVDARRLYQWKRVGIQANGDIAIEVSNGSTLSLPFLTVGVEATTGNFNGRVWLPIADIAPGESKSVFHDCYKRQLPRESVRLVDLGDPAPEDRDDFWEFRGSQTK